MLSINLWELLWTLVDFFLLYFVLKKLLIKPLTAFMEARQARIDQGLAQERQVEEALRAGEERLAGEKERCRAQARSLISQAREAAGEKQEEAARESRQEAQERRRQLREDAERLRQRELARLRDREPELTELLVARLLRRDGAPAGTPAVESPQE